LVWATRTFIRRSVAKSSLYRHEVRQTAIDALVEAVTGVASGAGAHKRPLVSFAERFVVQT